MKRQCISKRDKYTAAQDLMGVNHNRKGAKEREGKLPTKGCAKQRVNHAVPIVQETCL